jgi:hypothetical protein
VTPYTIAATLLLLQAPARDSVAILVGAGDIADCGKASYATAALLDSIPGTVFTAGDNAYSSGSADQFTRCYEPTWGRHKAHTRPTLGNHDYQSAHGAPYYHYFGAHAGDSGAGYYSYTLGAWHVVALNSNVGMAPGSAQEQWLRADLAAPPHSAKCTLAYWHHPLFSSGEHGNYRPARALWQALYDAGADVVISGHDHIYERFAPQTPAGALDTARGIREFVVGTGGADLYEFSMLQRHSEARNNRTHGVLKLTLRPSGYDWEFVPTPGGKFRDEGSGECH